MSDCCLTNLGCLQIPTSVISTVGQAGANGSVWLNGSGNPLNTLGNNGDYYINIDNGQVWVKAAGSFSPLLNITGTQGLQGPAGFARVAYNLPDILSGSGGTSGSKIFITQPILAADMPQTEGSSLVLTFNVRTENVNQFFSTRNIGITFGGVSCVEGNTNPGGLTDRIPISDGAGYETQIKVEVIRGIDSTVGYARVSYYGISSTFSTCYNESNPLSGLNFGLGSSFEIFGRQNAQDTFRFSLLTVDKITAQ